MLRPAWVLGLFLAWVFLESQQHLVIAGVWWSMLALEDHLFLWKLYQDRLPGLEFLHQELPLHLTTSKASAQSILSYAPWQIWNDRNEDVFDHSPVVPNFVIYSALLNAKEYQLLILKLVNLGSQATLSSNLFHNFHTSFFSSWVPLPPCWLKLNFDGSLKPNGVGGAGIVLCESMGWLLVAIIIHLSDHFVIMVELYDCPLDFSWANFTLAASACSNQDERGKCCRYINAFVAISIARFANSTGKLGVPSAFSDICLTSVSETFKLYGIPTSATAVCGLGPKIRVSYQCEGRGTVLEMMQSPKFTDVIGNCKVPLSLDSSCKRCLNYGIMYLHNLIGADDNVTLSVCRNAVFVTLATQGDNLVAVDMASCFFGVHGLSIQPESSSQLLSPTSSPSSDSSQAPNQHLGGIPVKKHQQAYRLTLITGIGIGFIAVSILLLLILILLIHKKSKELMSAVDPNETSQNGFPPTQVRRSQEGPSSVFRRFNYSEIKKGTENFSTVIGKGGFGTVYKAKFSDGSIAAVKRMDKVSKQGEDEFCREMELLSRLHHRHLVALKGFCVERNERFLVYEYMANGSLNDHLHSPKRTPLSWKTRVQIAIDVANALEYLHFYCDPPLCHRDIKSSNILLDENFVAKVADFGLAHASRYGAISFEPVNTDIRGTPGYMDPEYVVSHELTEKSDIYSYGVLLLELVTGRRAIQDSKNLVGWSQKFMTNDSKLPELVDPVIGNLFDFEQLQLIVGIVQWCTQKEGRARPSIKQVLRILAERCNLVHNSLEQLVEDEDGNYVPERNSRVRMHPNEVIPYSGDGRCLQSSSSTSRSCCSRSVLLESGSPQSPGLNSV